MSLKNASTDHDVHSLIRERWSPRAFSGEPVPAQALATILEAARWSPSCLNEQPWRFVVASRSETEAFERLLSCLTAANRVWAGQAGAFIFTLARETFLSNGEPNRYAWHDVGISTGMLILQAGDLGIQVHPMAGFDADRTRAELSIPAGYAPVTALALGYPGDAATLPPELAARERASRTRKPLNQRAYAGRFGEPLEPAEDSMALDVLTFWFGDVDAMGRAPDMHASRWWKKSAAFDKTIREQFSETHRALAAGECEDWLLSAEAGLAYVVVLDQFSRNMYRGTPEMFANDGQALDAALRAINRGMDRALPADMRSFFYLPLMHSESLPQQERCVELFAMLMMDLPREARGRIRNNLKYAGQHRDIIARFGRFPHRNALLGRKSTAEEAAFLKEPGSSF